MVVGEVKHVLNKLHERRFSLVVDFSELSAKIESITQNQLKLTPSTTYDTHKQRISISTCFVKCRIAQLVNKFNNTVAQHQHIVSNVSQKLKYCRLLTLSYLILKQILNTVVYDPNYTILKHTNSSRIHPLARIGVQNFCYFKHIILI